MSPSWPTSVGRHQPGLTGAGQRDEAEAIALVELDQLAARPRVGQLAFDEADGAGRVGPLAHGAVGQEAPVHLVGGPRHGGDRRDARGAGR